MCIFVRHLILLHLDLPTTVDTPIYFSTNSYYQMAVVEFLVGIMEFVGLGLGGHNGKS